MLRDLYLLVVAITICASAFTQSLHQDSSSLSSKKIERMNQYVLLKISQSSDVERFSVHTNSMKVKLNPNASSITSLSFNYRFISFQFSRVARFLPGNNDDENRGKTRSNRFGLSMNFKRCLNDLSYSRTKGYYLENTSDYDPSWNTSKPYIQFPDLWFTQYQLVSAYKFNNDFSVNAIAFQTERQIRSAGSFIPQFRARYYINDDRSVVPANQYTQKARNLELLIGAGYHYTLVANRQFYFSLGLTPGVGYVFSKIYSRGFGETLVAHQKNFIFRVDGRVGAGYNGERFIGGAYLNLASAAFRQQHTTVTTNNDRLSIQVFLGYRLKAPTILRRIVDAAEAKMNAYKPKKS